MKRFEIKNRFTGKVLFSLECGSLKLCVEAAVEVGADLYGANLRGADLYGADGEKIKISKTPLQILTEVYDIIIFDSHMKIGCEFHSIKDWWKFSDKEIIAMDNSTAKKFWDAWRSPLMSICKANGRG